MAQTLYRKYRSQRFAEIVGQKPVIRILANSIQRGRMNHAYLFAGPRGTGKTSIARIFAKAINCENPADGDACGECSVCTAIAEGRAVDVIEIDAASNRGIDDIRDLREKVGYAPLNFKFKVYIIDEVHMITPQGFNALLKTLEEPPGHVIFLLCTTEPAKLPVTILSRCIRFDLQRLPQDELAAHLVHIATEEGFEMGLEAATQLASLAECSARDAISLLDQLMVYCDGQITQEAIGELFQLGSVEAAATMVDRLAAGDATAAIGAWQELVAEGVDPGRFLLYVAGELKNRYLETHDQKYLDALHAAWEGVNLLKQEGFPALLVELSLLNIQSRLAAPAAPQTTAAPAPSQTSRKPEMATSPTLAEENAPPVKPETAQQTAKQEPEEQRSQSASAQRKAASSVEKNVMAGNTDELWTRFLNELKNTRLTTYALVAQHVSLQEEGHGEVLVFEPAVRQAYYFAQKSEHLAALSQTAVKVLGSSVTIRLMISGEPDTLVPRAETPHDLHEDLPEEVLHDTLDASDFGEPAGEVDPTKLEAAAEELESGLKNKQQAGATPSAQEAISLFDAIELESEEN